MKWVSVKDDLPAEDMSVLTYSTKIGVSFWGASQRHKSIDLDFYSVGEGFCYYEHEWVTRCYGWRFWKVLERCRNVVTHWMPEPDPPPRGW